MRRNGTKVLKTKLKIFLFIGMKNIFNPYFYIENKLNLSITYTKLETNFFSI
jgi:hypothetical protein